MFVVAKAAESSEKTSTKNLCTIRVITVHWIHIFVVMFW